MITRTVGKGSITYLGTLPDAAFLRELLSGAVRDAGVRTGANAVGDNVEICERSTRSSDSPRRVVIVINHNEIGKRITLSGHLKNLLPDGQLTLTQDSHAAPITQFDLGPQGVAVLVSETAQ
jgi:beta-galactosidase